MYFKDFKLYTFILLQLKVKWWNTKTNSQNKDEENFKLKIN